MTLPTAGFGNALVFGQFDAVMRDGLLNQQRRNATSEDHTEVTQDEVGTSGQQRPASSADSESFNPAVAWRQGQGQSETYQFEV
jgi:hypothetical protein